MQNVTSKTFPRTKAFWLNKKSELVEFYLALYQFYYSCMISLSLFNFRSHGKRDYQGRRWKNTEEGPSLRNAISRVKKITMINSKSAHLYSIIPNIGSQSWYHDSLFHRRITVLIVRLRKYHVSTTSRELFQFKLDETVHFGIVMTPKEGDFNHVFLRCLKIRHQLRRTTWLHIVVYNKEIFVKTLTLFDTEIQKFINF